MPITDLMVLDGTEAAPNGWKKIDKDLNAGAGGDYLYFAYDKGKEHDPITSVVFVEGKNAVAPAGYFKIDTDVNKGAGGEYIYPCFSRNRSQGEAITDLDVLIADEQGAWPAAPRLKVDVDLNKGARGKYIFLTYKNV